jgi:hypothetical protein
LPPREDDDSDDADDDDDEDDDVVDVGREDTGVVPMVITVVVAAEFDRPLSTLLVRR